MKRGWMLNGVDFFVLTLALVGGAIGACAGTINSVWNGGTGNWSVPTDWTPNGVPNNGGGNVYNVTIDSGGTDLVSLDLHATIASLVLGGTTGSSELQNLSGTAETLEVTGATTINKTGNLTLGNASTLKLDGGLTIARFGQFNVNGGTTATITGNVNNSGFLHTGLVAGSNTVNVSGTFTNNKGASVELSGSGDVVTVNALTNNGTLYLAGIGSSFTVTGPAGSFSNVNSSGTLSGGTYNLGGTFQYTGPGITNVASATSLSVGGAFNNVVGGVPHPALAGLTSVEGSVTLANGKTYSVTPGGGTLTVSRSGTMAIDSGTALSVTGNVSNSGSFTSGGGSVNVSGTFTNNSKASLILEGSEDKATVNALTNNGTLGLTGPDSSFTVTGPAGSFSNLSSSGSLSGGTYLLEGTFQYTGHGIRDVASATKLTLDGGGAINNVVGGVPGPALTGLSSVEGSLTLANGKTFSVTPGGGTLSISTAGAMLVSAGTTLSVTGNVNNLGAFVAGSNRKSTVDVSGTFTNNAGASLNLQYSGNVVNVGNFSNAGTFTIGSGSSFTVGGSGVFTQTGGKTTDDGTLTDSGGFSLNGGSLFGTGTISGAVTSSATITPGDSSTGTGILTDKGVYTQNSTGGVLDISIDGMTAGTQYDQFNPTTANLNGTLNITRPTGFVPSIGTTFKIMNFNSETGTFSTVNGLAINPNEHFTITYQGSDVLLTVVKGPCCAPQSGSGQFNGSSTVGPTYSAVEPSWFGFGPGARGYGFDYPSRGWPLAMPLGLSRNSKIETRPGVQFRISTSGSRLHTSPNPYLDRGVISAAKLASMDFVGRQSVLSRRGIDALGPTRNFSAPTGAHSFVSARTSGAIHNRINPAGVLLRNNGHAQRMTAPKSVAYHLDLLSILGTSRRHLWRGLLGQPGSPSAADFGYLTFGGSH